MHTPDETLREFATDAQWDAYLCYCKHANYAKAAIELGISPSNLHGQVQRLKNAALEAGKVPTGYKVAKVSSTYDEAGQLTRQSVQVKAEGADPASVAQVPDPKKIVKTSTLYDGDGRVTAQWVMEKPEDVMREKAWRAFADELKADIVPLPPTPYTEDHDTDDLLTLYPIGDHHFGMLAWGKETRGEDWDIAIAEKTLANCMSYLLQGARTKRAVIAVMGDFLHFDGMIPVTPQSKHQLDSDSRPQKMIRAALRALKAMVVAGLKRHEQIILEIEPGNHDPYGAGFLTESLALLFENEPRVTVETRPGWYHYVKFGKNLIGFHHGDGAKPSELPLIMANHEPEAWGETTHRVFFIGHVHHKLVQDFVGCTVEALRILAPKDAWAAHKGYDAPRNMHAIVYHREYGEVDRRTVNPVMFEAA